jgi:putative ABC transport system permease protein
MEKMMPLASLLHNMEENLGFRQATAIVLGVALGAALLVLIVLCLIFPKYFSFILKNVRRNLLRTTLASMAIIVLVFVVTIVWSILVPLSGYLTEKASDIKAIVSERRQAGSQLPYSYADTLERGAPREDSDVTIKNVDSMTWSFFVGTTDKEHMSFDTFVFFFAMDPRKLPTMMDELEKIDPSSVKKMTERLDGCILGSERLTRLNKKIGETIKVSAIGAFKDIDLDFTIVGTFPDLPRYNNSGVMNRDYLQRALDDYERKNGKKHPAAEKSLSLVWLRVPDMQDFGKLSNQVMASPLYTNPAVKCETASSGSASFFESYKDLLWGLKWLLVPALLSIMALVMAMAISISVRERRTEMAVLKVLGFTPGRVLALVLGEALLVGSLSGLASAALAYGAINLTLEGIPFPLAWISIWPILPDALWWGVVIGALTSLAGSSLPAWNARRIKVSEVFAKIA